MKNYKILEETTIKLEEQYIDLINQIVYSHNEFLGCEIYIFGSRARNKEGSERSDIDIILKLTNKIADTKIINQIIEELHAVKVPFKKDIWDWNNISEKWKENIQDEMVRIDPYRIMKYNDTDIDLYQNMQEIIKYNSNIYWIFQKLQKSTKRNYEITNLYTKLINTSQLSMKNIHTILFALDNNYIDIINTLLRRQIEMYLKLISFTQNIHHKHPYQERHLILKYLKENDFITDKGITYINTLYKDISTDAHTSYVISDGIHTGTIEFSKYLYNLYGINMKILNNFYNDNNNLNVPNKMDAFKIFHNQNLCKLYIQTLKDIKDNIHLLLILLDKFSQEEV